jgi:Domain of unknown function (DUF6457)
MTAQQWLEGFAQAAGIAAPTPHEMEQLLKLAAVAAHASERTAAPVVCYLAGRAGLDLSKAIALAEAAAPA